MNYEIAKRIMDDKPSEAEHIYIDEDNVPRDKHIENLFRDLYAGVPLDELFRNNFEVYVQELLSDRSHRVPRGIFIDAETALRWVEKFVGTVKVTELRKPLADNLRWSCQIRSEYAKRVKLAHAPHRLHAILLSVVFVCRSIATDRLNEFFKEAING